MGVLFGILAGLAGTSKAVSVCGINSAALLAEPRNWRSGAIVGYAAALWLGGLILIALVVALGRIVWLLVPADVELRLAGSGLALAIVGLLEMWRGPWLLPHVAWAVPRSWAESPSVGLPLFGLIRGIAVFNHSPFASMHMLLVAIFMGADSVPVLPISGAFALGLGIWSALYAVVGSRARTFTSGIVGRLTGRTLASNETVARVDGAALVLSGLALIWLIWRTVG